MWKYFNRLQHYSLPRSFVSPSNIHAPQCGSGLTRVSRWARPRRWASTAPRRPSWYSSSHSGTPSSRSRCTRGDYYGNNCVASTILLLLCRCLDCSGNYLQCKQIVSQLPTSHKNVFEYLTGELKFFSRSKMLLMWLFAAFLREVIAHSAKNGTDPVILATLFCTMFIRDPPNTKFGAGVMGEANQQMLTKKKAAFMHHFLVNDPDEWTSSYLLGGSEESFKKVRGRASMAMWSTIVSFSFSSMMMNIVIFWSCPSNTRYID